MKQSGKTPGRRGTRRRLALIAIAGLAATAAGTGVLPGTGAGSARADEVMASQNNLRDGWDAAEPALSPAVVGGGSFGRMFSTAVNGQVYAQPIVVGNTVIVATENDWVYGINATTGSINWQVSLGAPWPSSAIGCRDLTPNIGVTGTPVYDPANKTVYMVARIVPPGGSDSSPLTEMVGVVAGTGRITQRITISGAPVNDPSRPFVSFRQMQRPALMLMNGSVYAAFGSFCDFQPYAGYVAGVNVATSALTLWTDEAGIASGQAGIWQSGGGIMSDGPGRLFVTSGNGVSPPPGPGTSPPAELGDSVVRLSVQSNGSLTAQDFFSPADAATLNANDLDLGAGAPTGLPFGSATYPALLMQAGKDGIIRLLDRNALGGREQGPGGTDNPVSSTGPYAGQWGHPATFGDTPTITPTDTGNDYVYYTGNSDYLRALKFGFNAAGRPALADVANSTTKFGYTSGPPVVTSDGTNPASALVWEIYSSGGSGSGGTLEAFDAMPQTPCSATVSGPCLRMIWSAPIGTASKFAMPATNGGRVYVGTRDGHVIGFGVTAAAPLTGAAPVNFGTVPVGQTSAPHTVAETATSTVTVTGVSTTSTTSANPFSAGPASVTSGGVTKSVVFPVTLSAGDVLSVPVRFSPTAAGGVSGSVAFATTYPGFPSVAVSLTGSGGTQGLVASPSRLSFYQVPVGASVTKTLTITNDSTSALKVTLTAGPKAPFTAQGLPTVGSSIAANQSIPVAVTFTPTAAVTSYTAITVSYPGGHVTVNLAGHAIDPVAKVTAAPVNFGSAPVGKRMRTVISITNRGNLPVALDWGAASAAAFAAPMKVPAGLPVDPSYEVQIPITFTPARAGAFTGYYRLHWQDSAGAHTTWIRLTGYGRKS